VRPLDELLPAFDVHEVHAVELPLSPEEAMARVVALPLTSDPLVRRALRRFRVSWLAAVRGGAG
jgi:hypothetical protein